MALKFTHNLYTKKSLYYGNRLCIKYIFGYIIISRKKKYFFSENIINSIESNKPNLTERVVL